MEIDVNIYLTFIFSFLMVFSHDFFIYIDITRMELQTQQLMKSQIRSQIRLDFVINF